LFAESEQVFVRKLNRWKDGLEKKGMKLTLVQGWLSPTERASVSAISLRHILAWVRTPLGLAVNVTWMERGFNTGQIKGIEYPSIFNRL